MNTQPLEVVRGSGNVYRDLGYPDADVRQLKAMIAAEIIKALDKQNLSIREAQRKTKYPAAEFSRIRNARLERFTVDRLILMLVSLGKRVDVKLKIKEAA